MRHGTPSRRDVLKASAGLAASAVIATPLKAPPPEPSAVTPALIAAMVAPLTIDPATLHAITNHGLIQASGAELDISGYVGAITGAGVYLVLGRR